MYEPTPRHKLPRGLRTEHAKVGGLEIAVEHAPEDKEDFASLKPIKDADYSGLTIYLPSNYWGSPWVYFDQRTQDRLHAFFSLRNGEGDGDADTKIGNLLLECKVT